MSDAEIFRELSGIREMVNSISVAQARCESKVDGINDRLDRLNGQTAKHAAAIEAVETDVAEQRTWLKVVKYVGSAVALLVGGHNVPAIIQNLLGFSKE